MSVPLVLLALQRSALLEYNCHMSLLSVEHEDEIVITCGRRCRRYLRRYLRLGSSRPRGEVTPVRVRRHRRHQRSPEVEGRPHVGPKVSSYRSALVRTHTMLLDYII